MTVLRRRDWNRTRLPVPVEGGYLPWLALPGVVRAIPKPGEYPPLARGLMKSSLAVFPGSFDPVHNGHLRVLRHASDLFPKVIWAVARDSPKTPMFTVEQRLEMMRLVDKPDNVEIASFAGLLADFAIERGASHIVRSLRVAMDFDYEYRLMLANHRIAPNVQTIYFPAEQEDIHLNSTMIRELLRLGRVLPGYVPSELGSYLAALISGKRR